MQLARWVGWVVVRWVGGNEPGPGVTGETEPVRSVIRGQPRKWMVTSWKRRCFVNKRS